MEEGNNHRLKSATNYPLTKRMVPAPAPAPTPAHQSGAASSTLFQSPPASFYNVDQSVNLMDVNAANYSVEGTDSQKNSTKSSNAITAGQGSSLIDALTGNNDNTRTSSGWSGIARPDKLRRQTWDTSPIGRLTVWLIFFSTLFFFSFLIPFLLIHNSGVSDDNAEVNGISRVPDVLVESNGKSRFENIKAVVLQSGITSTETLQDETSDAYRAVVWLSETDPAVVVPMVNHFDNTELLQRYSLAVLFYAANSNIRSDIHSQSIQKEDIGHMSPHSPHGDEAPTPTTNPLMALDHAPPNFPTLTASAKTLETTSSTKTGLNLTQSAHLKNHAVVSLPQSQSQQVASRQSPGPQSKGSLWNSDNVQRGGEVADTKPRVVRMERDGQGGRRVEEGNNLRNSDWLRDQSWMSAASVCDWHGVACDQNPNQKDAYDAKRIVVRLNLTANNLHGTIPSELEALSKLTFIDLSHNRLTGKIPMKFCRRLPLERVHLNDNRLTGSIPSELAHSTKMIELNLSNNTLTGTLPATLSNLRHLRILRLEDNRFTGSIPAMLELAPTLNILRLGGNSFNGKLGIHIFQLKKLVNLGLQRNSLSGTFPPEVDTLHFLQELDVSGNQITGSLPDIFPRFHGLKSLYLQDNRFEGLLPTSLGRLRTLETLTLSSNSYNGSIPVQWSGMTSLETLLLDHNTGLTGSMPLCGLKEIGSLTLLTAPCDKVHCTCCDNCAASES